METESIWQAIGRRLRPGQPLSELDVPEGWLVGALGAALLVVVVPTVWRVLRVAVTVVHELGHAVVGLLVGRKFTGLVLRPDMSGHVVTVGPSRGAGRVVTTWAGYPAPALLGLALIWAAHSGWAPPMVFVIALACLAGLLRVRSLYTALVMGLAVAGSGWLWWSAEPVAQGLVLAGVGVVLLLGAWRHLAAVIGRPSGDSDPAVLGRITPLPAVLWTITFVIVLALATWAALTMVAELLDFAALPWNS